jgi:hypothetical protein
VAFTLALRSSRFSDISLVILWVGRLPDYLAHSRLDLLPDPSHFVVAEREPESRRYMVVGGKRTSSRLLVYDLQSRHLSSQNGSRTERRLSVPRATRGKPCHSSPYQASLDSRRVDITSCPTRLLCFDRTLLQGMADYLNFLFLISCKHVNSFSFVKVSGEPFQ